MSTVSKAKQGKVQAKVQEKAEKKAEVQAAAPAEEKKTTRVKVAPPPKPQIRVGEVMNPLNDGARFKRALCVAWADEMAKLGHPVTEPENLKKVAVLCRECGLVQKLGTFGEKGADGAENLTPNEHSGLSYARGTALRFWNEEYHIHGQKEKVDHCRPFAVASLKAFFPKLAG